MAKKTEYGRQAADEVMEAKAGEVLEYLNDVVSGWSGDSKPRFVIVKTQGDKFVTWLIEAAPGSGRIFSYVDKGTGQWGKNKKKYPIPKEGPRDHPLRFRGGYVPRTRPGPSYGGPGKATGGWFSPYQVMHPGIRPRDFTKKAIENITPAFRRDMNNALRRAMRRNV